MTSRREVIDVAARARPILGTVIFFFVAPCVVAGWVPYALSHWRVGPPLLAFPPGRWIGAALVAAGAAVLVDSFARFALQGEGTPAPVAPTRRLVVTGLYRYVRNPMYVAVVAIILGQALLLASVRLLVYAAMIWAVVHVFVLTYEEPTLSRRYGDSYREYRQEVRRWWPRLRPWTGGSP